MIEYKSFLVGDLFEIRPTKSYGLTNDKLLKEKGATPVVSNLSVNNGVLDYINLESTEQGGILTFSDTGTNATESIFYQPRDFIGYSHVQGMYPKFSNKFFTKNVALYISTAIRKSVKGLYDFSAKFNRDNVKKTYIELPVNELAEPDWAYMDVYMDNVENKLNGLILKYLKKQGFKSKQDLLLTDKELKILQHHDIMNFEEFYLKDLFNIKNTSNLMLNEISEKNGKVPYVTASQINNGIQSYINHHEILKMDGNSIFIGGKTFTVFYQEHDYFSNDSHNLWLCLKDTNFNNKYCNLYLVAAIKRGLSWKYSWDSSISSAKIVSDVIKLPVRKDNKTIPDYKFIEMYMKAIEKKNILKMIDEIDLKFI